MSSIPPIIPTDGEVLEARRRGAGTESLWPLVARYLGFVYSSSLRRMGRADLAAALTRAVFLVLARRAHRLRKRTVLAEWLFHVTAVACRKIAGKHSGGGGWRWFRRRPRREWPPEASLWDRVAAELDAAIERLPNARRSAVLLRTLRNQEWDSVAGTLRVSERRARRRVEHGLKQLCGQLRKRGVTLDPETLEQIGAVEGCAAPLPEGLSEDIQATLEARPGGSPSFDLARRTLNTLAWARWRRRFAIAIPACILLLATLAGTLWYIDSRSGHSRLIAAFIVWSARTEARRVPGLAQPARPWPASSARPGPHAAGIRAARDLYQTTNIWLAHLQFTREQWRALEPRRIGALPHFFQPDGTVLLRHPGAQRSGLAGVLGFDFDWASADLQFGGLAFTNVAVRFKGNGTYLASLHGDKRPFKVDLNRLVQGRKLGDLDELNFNNLINDASCLSDALAYEFFRDAGVPAPRTAYAYLSVSVDGKWTRKPLGLYVMVEPVDERFAAERFGSPRTPVFKPVTYELFQDLGDDWPAYEAIYDLKTKATPEQQRRVIQFARLVTSAGEAEFATQLGEFLDLEKFARYLACEVLLSNYDGFLSDGQNFHVYLDPASNRFGFIPWDLDLSWGGFFLLGTARERERASIWHPWVGRHRFLERVMGVEQFRQLYRAQLEDLLARLFVPNRLHQRIDALAHILRGPIAAESDFRLGKFEQAVSDRPLGRSPSRETQGADRPAHQLKRFIEARASSVRQQLDGASAGHILTRRARQ